MTDKPDTPINRQDMQKAARTRMVSVALDDLLRWGTAFPVLATMLEQVLCYGAAEKARSMSREQLLTRAHAVERELFALRNLALQLRLPLEQRDRLRLAHDTLTYFIVEEAAHG